MSLPAVKCILCLTVDIARSAPAAGSVQWPERMTFSNRGGQQGRAAAGDRHQGLRVMSPSVACDNDTLTGNNWVEPAYDAAGNMKTAPKRHDAEATLLFQLQ